jgi:hypothetical protein
MPSTVKRLSLPYKDLVLINRFLTAYLMPLAKITVTIWVDVKFNKSMYGFVTKSIHIRKSQKSVNQICDPINAYARGTQINLIALTQTSSDDG